MPSIRGILDDVETALEEDQAPVAVVGALGGAVGAFVVERFGRQGERAARSDRDRRLAKKFADDVETLRLRAPATEGRSW